MISELLVIFLVSVLLLFGLKSRRKVPPGPPQVPILGSIPFLTLEKGVGDYFLDECVTRNKISTVAVGPVYKPFIINDFELAKVYSEYCTYDRGGIFSTKHIRFTGAVFKG